MPHKQEVWRQGSEQAGEFCSVNSVASLRAQVHFIFLLCPLLVSLTLQLPALVVARWLQQPRLSHPMTAPRGRKGTVSSKTNKPLPEAPQNFSFTSHWLHLHPSPVPKPTTHSWCGGRVRPDMGNKEEMGPGPAATAWSTRSREKMPRGVGGKSKDSYLEVG